MKAIRLYAYLYHNLGDDLMVEVLLKRYKDCMFYCDSHMPIRNERLVAFPNFIDKEKMYIKFGRLNHLLNILTFHKKDNFFFDWLFGECEKRCQCSVYIGGSLYIPRVNESLEDRIVREKKKMEQSPLFVIGANFGEEEKAFEEAFREYFSLCGGVSFRDKSSYNKFSMLENTQYAPDVVLGLDVPAGEPSNSRNTVLISVIDFHRRERLLPFEHDYDQFVIKTCKECVNRGKQPILVSFCEEEGDPVAIERILQCMPENIRDKTGCLYYRNNLPELFEVFRGTDFVIATRFHAMILAWRFKKPFFCISYNEKIKHAMQDINNSAYCEVDSISAVSMADVFAMEQPINIDEYIKLAEKQFAQLEDFLLGL